MAKNRSNYTDEPSRKETGKRKSSNVKETPLKQSKDKPKKAFSAASPNSNFWWQDDEVTPINERIWGLLNSMEKFQKTRQNQFITNARLYGDHSYLNSNLSSFRSTVNNSERLTLNVIASCVDTLVSKIATKKPEPKFLTSGGTWKQQQKAKNLNKLTAGVMYNNSCYEKGQDVFRDTVIQGDGIAKICEDEVGEIIIERVPPHEIILNELECYYGNPPNMYQHKYYHKAVLASLYPEREKEIYNSSLLFDRDRIAVTFMKDNVDDYCSVVEAWHLPSNKNAADGKHCIITSDCVLLEEDYAQHKFPFVFLKYIKPRMGFWSYGIPQKLTGIQVSINVGLRNIDRSLRLMSVPTIYMENNAKIVGAHFNEEIGRIINYTQTKPIIEVAQAVSPELFQYVENMYQKAFQECGLSQLSTQSQKPPGMNSGIAIQSFNDIESERFLELGQAYERFYMEIADRIVSLARAIYERDGSFSVKAPGKKNFELIDWKDCDLSEDAFYLTMNPTSGLPNTTAGRLQRVQDLLNMKMIDTETGRDLLDFPDLDKQMSLEESSRNAIRMIVEQILEKGKYESPDPNDDLNFAVKYALQALHIAKIDKVPMRRREKLAQYISEAQELLASTQQPAPPAQQPPAQSEGQQQPEPLQQVA